MYLIIRIQKQLKQHPNFFAEKSEQTPKNTHSYRLVI
jgi:hypothetical protein